MLFLHDCIKPQTVIIVVCLKKWIVRFFRTTPSYRLPSSFSSRLFSFGHFWTSSKCGKSQGPFAKNRRRFFTLQRRFFGHHPSRYKRLNFIMVVYNTYWHALLYKIYDRTFLYYCIKKKQTPVIVVCSKKMDSTFFYDDSIAPPSFVFFVSFIFVWSFLDVFQMR